MNSHASDLAVYAESSLFFLNVRWNMLRCLYICCEIFEDRVVCDIVCSLRLLYIMCQQ